MQAASFSGESPEDIIAGINNSELKTPSLGIIFSSVSLDIPLLSGSLSECPFPVAGCSSSGEILFREGSTPISELSAVGVLLDPPQESFRTSLFPRGGRDPYQLGREIGGWGSREFEEPVFLVLLSGLSVNGEEIIRGIEESFPTPPKVYGGVAGDDGRFEETYVFLNGSRSPDGVVVILLDGSAFGVYNLVTGGWRGIGLEKTITRAEGNVVSLIEGRPALDLYTEYLNLREDDIPWKTIDFPLIVRRSDGTEVARALLAADRENRALVFSGSVPEGSSVRFSSSAGIEAIQSSIADISRESEKIRKADLILVISCMARYQATGEHAAEEIIAAAESGDCPLIGFFSYGEIGNNHLGHCEYYSETFSLVALTLKKVP
jgi:hypothetical protein